MRKPVTPLQRPAREDGDTEIVRPSGLAEEVFRRIRADIVSLRLPPDTRFTVDGLARTLGVSQTPIREALSMLEASGLVLKRHYLGYTTAPLMDKEALGEAYQVRLLLEPFAARRAAERIGKEQRKHLTEVVNKMMLKADASSRSEDFPYQDTEFHRVIAEASESQLIAQLLDRLNAHLHIFRLGTDQKFESAAIREHRNIANAVLKGDGPGAEKAMRDHISKSFARLQHYIKK